MTLIYSTFGVNFLFVLLKSQYYQAIKNMKFTHLKEHGFHDYHLKNFQIQHGKRGFRDPVEVRLTVTDEENTWTIIYKKIKKIVANYEQEPDIFPGMGRRFYEGFDDYGFNEFFEIDDKALSHEILFASGATILIHFEKISIKKETDLMQYIEPVKLE